MLSPKLIQLTFQGQFKWMIVKWMINLERHLVYTQQRVVKGKALADFLAGHPILNEWKLNDDLLGDKVFFVDVLPPWEKHILPYSFALTQPWSDNMAEYQAFVLGLQMAIEMGIRNLNIYGDSQLALNKPLEELRVKKDDLISYHKHAFTTIGQAKNY